MIARVLSAAILAVALGGCNHDNANNAGPDADDSNPPVDWDDAGNPIYRDAGSGSGITVTCADPPAAVPVNTQVTLTCTIDSGGRSVSAPVLSVTPPDGVELANATQVGTVHFALSTGKAGYKHPFDFQDTVYQVSVEVHDVAHPAQFGRGTAEITVLGNYWVGDGASNGQGIYVFDSHGGYLTQIVGQAGIMGVTDLCMLPSGDIAASSEHSQVIDIFTRQGVAQPVTFEHVDKFSGGVDIWSPGGYVTTGPNHMAVSSLGELWVTGPYENKIYGLAVFDPATGTLQKFLPHPDGENGFKFTSIARRTDGKIAASFNERREICLWDEKSYASGGCFSAGDIWSGSFAVLLAMPDAQLLVGPNETSDAAPLLLNPTLGTVVTFEKIYEPAVTGMAVSGVELVALGNFGQSCCNPQLARWDLASNQLEDPLWTLAVQGGGGLMNVSGLVRLTPPGQ